jgi:exonuclease SbcC
MAAFAFSNGDIRKSYETIYSSFKKYYTEQHGQWDTLDLAFVFCVKPDIPNLDQFCSSVETDVYFCRKFVIPLAQPLGLSLARLPFLPLTPLDGQSLRPPSAQTFLHQCGVPTVLARHLVVQRERGPERIVEDCINGDFGEPAGLVQVKNALVVQPEHATEPIRLESVTIKNFRAYRKPQTFALGADVTVLYGANGFGKTSFFDAFDFATTGEIGRIKSRGDEHFRKTAPHLDSSPEESTVSLSFWDKGAIRKLSRTVGDRKNALLDGVRRERKAILGEITSGTFPATDRVENFVSLFRATHLFNQEQPELTKDFQEDCRLPSEIVARMLAFEDYASAANKATKVRAVLDGIIAEANSQIAQFSDQIADERSELDRLSKTVKATATGETLETELQVLVKRLGEVGVFVGSEKADAAAIRGWRASLEARLAESQSRGNRLSALAKEIPGIAQARAEVLKLEKQVSEKELAHGTAEKNRIAAEAVVQRINQQIAETSRDIAEAQRRVDLIEWIRVTKPIYRQLIDKQRAVSETPSRAKDALEEERTKEERIAAELRRHEELAARLTEELKSNRLQLAAAESVNDSIVTWRANRARVKVLTESEEAATKALDVLRAEARELSSQTTTIAAEDVRLSRGVAETEKNQSELKRLVSQLVGYVQGGTCPLCGEDHGSRDQLVRRIQNHVSIDIASGARADLTSVRDRARNLAEQTAQNVEKQRAAETQVTELRAERGKLDADIVQFVTSAEKVGVALDASGQAPTKQLQTLRGGIQQEIEKVEQQVKEANAVVDATRTTLRDVRAGIATKMAEVAEQTAGLKRLQEQIAELRDDPRAIQMSLDSDDKQLAEQKRLADTQLSEFRSKATSAQNEIVQKKAELTAVQQDSAALKTQLSGLRTQLANSQKLISQVTARLSEERLPPDASEEVLLKATSEESRMQAQFLSLRDSASSLELAMDTATTSAALTQMRQNVRNKEKVVLAATQTRDQHLPWVKYFIDLERLVSSQQSDAIASFTREYGPRTSVIQRRLRSVYGFDEVEIRSRDSEISVRVKRHGEELRPTDYFSQSQQQTLFLGLFLTACISQTWSAFSPVFLDDPVTHFDDLNTYAFLDLIVGLLEPTRWSRQFVISTCDEKLLQLARQKFRHLGDRAKFYRFASISEDGPSVEEVRSS